MSTSDIDHQYAIGFAEGETQRFHDKSAGLIRAMPHPWQLKNMRSWGFWDGYMPRSASWATGAKPMMFESVEA
jgi:hypothetical protein